jgi:O-Antigen ligase
VIGAKILLVLVAGALALVLLDRPRVATVALLVAAVFFESGTDSPFGQDAMYTTLPGLKLQPFEILLLLALGGSILERMRSTTGYARLGELAPPLWLLAAALLCAIVVGHYSGGAFQPISSTTRIFLPLLLVPFIVTTVVRSADDVRWSITFVAALAFAKSVLGLLLLFTGYGFKVEGSSSLTYYEPPGNWLAMLLLLFVLALAVGRQPIAAWLLAAVPFALASLALAQRRSFYIALVVGIAVDAVVAAGRGGRRMLVPIVAVFIAASYLMLTTGLANGLDSPVTSSVATRVQTLNAKHLEANKQDRYRIDERRNVLAEIGRSPVLGVGLGVPWHARYGLSVEHPGGREYTHIALLWFWLKLGALGLIGYLWLFGAILVVAARIGRRHADGYVRAAAWAITATTAGYLVAETTGTFTGANERMNVLLGAVVGFLSVAASQLPKRNIVPTRIEQ